MKRIYLYFKEKTERGEFSSRHMRMFLFCGLGLSSTLWFLIRVIPKPSRAYYPCMQTAAPMMSAFVTYLLSFTVTWWSGRKLYNAIRQRKVVVGIFSFMCLCLFGTMTLVENSTDLLAQAILPVTELRMAWGKNNPIGTPRGIYPGRVAWAYDPKAAAWDGERGLYSDANNNSQTRVNDMMEGVIISLTRQNTIDKAWEELFRTFNYKKGKGAALYKKGEKIAVKVNLNDNGGSNIIDATPQSVYALLHQLVDIMKVPQNCITIYDAQRRGISAIYDYVQPIYPDVNYQNWGGFVKDVIHYSREITDTGAMSLARAAYEADYMINMALMKRHSEPTDKWRDSAGQTGITSTGKNQFGSAGNVPPLHLSIRDWSSF